MTRQDRATDRLSAGRFPEPSRIDDLIAQAADLAICIDAEGLVVGISVNPNCPSLGCLDHWVGRPLSGFLTDESREKVDARLASMREDAVLMSRPIELNHVDNATWEFPVRYTFHRVEGSGEILLLGRDMQPVAEVQQKLLTEQLAREREQQKLRGEQTLYRVVLEASETPIVLVEAGRGRIRDLNSAAAELLGSKADTLAGSDFAQVFEGRRAPEMLDALQAAASADGAKRLDLVARRNGHQLTVLPEFFRAGGDLFALCRLISRDESAGTGEEVSAAMAALFTATQDAILLTDARGIIREANEAFLILADVAQLRDIKGRSFSDFLVRGSVDLKLMLDTVKKKEGLRSYSALFHSNVGTRSNVEISAARLQQRGGDMGFGLIIRQSAPAERIDVTEAAPAVSEEAMQNVMDLVGSASLKDLVSATSDVVEKMCIETAVQMTGNNRVAAAEMLGLSRQSLYVKLRKHGLLNADA